MAAFFFCATAGTAANDIPVKSVRRKEVFTGLGSSRPRRLGVPGKRKKPPGVAPADLILRRGVEMHEVA